MNEHSSSRNFGDDDVEDGHISSSIRYDNRRKKKLKKTVNLKTTGTACRSGTHPQRSQWNRQVVSDHNFLFRRFACLQEYFSFFLLLAKRVEKKKRVVAEGPPRVNHLCSVPRCACFLKKIKLSVRPNKNETRVYSVINSQLSLFSGHLPPCHARFCNLEQIHDHCSKGKPPHLARYATVT